MPKTVALTAMPRATLCFCKLNVLAERRNGIFMETSIVILVVGGAKDKAVLNSINKTEFHRQKYAV